MKLAFRKVFVEPQSNGCYAELIANYPRMRAKVFKAGLDAMERNLEFFSRDPYCLDALACEIRKDRL